MSCPFCLEPISHLTEWYYWDWENKIIVCRDLHNRGYKYRILIVKYGIENHRGKKNYTSQEKEKLREILKSICNAHSIERKGELVSLDEEHFSIREHFHIQANMVSQK